MGNNYILGGGITGLILLELLKDKGYKLITDEVGGQMANKFPLGPRILHYSNKAQKFLHSLNIYDEPEIFKAGYLVAGELVNEVSEELRKRYFNKTRGLSSKYNDSCLSAGANHIKGWDMNKINLSQALWLRNYKYIIYDKVSLIDTYNKKLYIDTAIVYNELISTIDLKDLFNMTGLESYQDSCKKRMVYYHLAKNLKPDVFDSVDGKELSYVYNIDSNSVNRITKLGDTSRIIEANYKLMFLYGYHILDTIEAQTQIQNELKLKNIQGIKLVGRYAQYDHSVKANNIIEEFYNE